MEKLRVTGLVVLVSSLASLALAGAVALLIATGLVPPLEMMPTAAQMLHGPTVLLAIAVGSVILTAMAVLSFSAVVKITTENFTATSALTRGAASKYFSGDSPVMRNVCGCPVGRTQTVAFSLIQRQDPSARLNSGSYHPVS